MGANSKLVAQKPFLREAAQQTPGREFVVAGFVEPRALDVRENEAGHEAREGERVNGELRDGFVGARIGLVIEDVDRAVADLQEVDVSGDVSRLVAGAGAGAVNGSLGTISTPYCSSSAAISSSRRKIGTSTATVVLSFISMKR